MLVVKQSMRERLESESVGDTKPRAGVSTNDRVRLKAVVRMFEEVIGKGTSDELDSKDVG